MGSCKLGLEMFRFILGQPAEVCGDEEADVHTVADEDDFPGRKEGRTETGKAFCINTQTRPKNILGCRGR